LSIGNGINEYSKTFTAFGISLLNVFLVFGFTYRLKKKIDFVTMSTKFATDDDEAKEVYLSVHTMMVQGLNRKFKIHKTQELLNDIFRTIYDENLIVKVTIVPELWTLDYCLLKKKEYNLKLSHFQQSNLRLQYR
jgi:hypothetical protein